ncbi:hypothetical protein BT93_D1744 [Corymbia citriodora subsp. variegata]|nr:hypothetical protein BT93_D1744 [Corymbia citriodora subsp. variegata]
MHGRTSQLSSSPRETLRKERRSNANFRMHPRHLRTASRRRLPDKTLSSEAIQPISKRKRNTQKKRRMKQGKKDHGHDRPMSNKRAQEPGKNRTKKTLLADTDQE